MAACALLPPRSAKPLHCPIKRSSVGAAAAAADGEKRFRLLFLLLLFFLLLLLLGRRVRAKP
jgi:hypothetical protein